MHEPLTLHGRHNENVNYVGNDGVSTLTWDDGSPHRGYMNPGDSFTTAASDHPVKIDHHSNNDPTNSDNDYMSLSTGIGPRKKGTEE